MPAPELAQEAGKVLRWLTAPGDRVAKGDPSAEGSLDLHPPGSIIPYTDGLLARLAQARRMRKDG